MSLRIRASVERRSPTEIGSRCLLATLDEIDALTSTSTRRVTTPPSTASTMDCSGEQVHGRISWLLRSCVYMCMFFGCVLLGCVLLLTRELRELNSLACAGFAGAVPKRHFTSAWLNHPPPNMADDDWRNNLLNLYLACEVLHDSFPQQEPGLPAVRR